MTLKGRITGSDIIRDKVVCVVGLGYVGLPLAEAFSEFLDVIGFDVDDGKIASLNEGRKNGRLDFTTDPSRMREADFVLICVPTPVTKSKDPDLKYVRSAAEIVGENLKNGAIVVLESTVYPGVTEEVVMPIIEERSGLKCGPDFKVGYSPERINPGDDDHVLSRITKVVSGIDDPTTEALSELYGLITTTYAAKDIKTAEAAKVIENVQRDLNIALMNELALIFHRIGLDVNAVIDAASTKWNFMRFSPGLVGGHCIPVDPYYLVYKAMELDYHPQVILAGRAINDFMPKYVAEMAIKGLNEVGKVIKGSRVLIMGLTYKENVPDTRESPVREMIKELQEFGIEIYGYDPLLDRETVEDFGVKALDRLEMKVDCVIVAVAHREFKRLGLEDVKEFSREAPVMIDVRGIFDGDEAERCGFYYNKL